MKIGDYVRFKTLCKEIKIGKVIDIITPDKNSMKKYCVYVLDNNEATIDDYVIKSSPDTIDLIEVGDYVNGEKVIRTFNPTFLSMGELPYVITDKSKYEPQEIKSIVTKEAFESMEYRIGE